MTDATWPEGFTGLSAGFVPRRIWAKRRVLRVDVFAGLCVSLLLVYSLGIDFVFGPALRDGIWEHVFGFTRIIIPDTLTYLSIANADSVAEFLLLAAIKNSIAPGLLWLASFKSWYVVSLFNAACVYLLLLYVRRLAELLRPDERRQHQRIALILTFVCAYYSVGALKEIPTMLGLTAFVCEFLMRRKARAFAWLAFLVLFRFQFGYLVIPVYFFTKFRRNPLRLTLVSLAIIGAVYPLFSFLSVLTPVAVELFRTSASTDSLGAQVEYVRSHILGLSLGAIVFRVLQSIFEPLILFVRTRSLFEDGSFSLYQAHAVVAALLLLPAWTTTAVNRFRLGMRDDRASFGILYAFLAVAVFAIGGTGLISHRFLVPTYALLLIAAYVKPPRRVPATPAGAE